MLFAKWQGLGNDYLVLEASELPGELDAPAVRMLCDRHLGVGADGILLHEPSSGAVEGAVARMRVLNPDGTEAEMCGNGMRIFARYLAQRGVTEAREFIVETLAGPIRPGLLPDGQVRVDMGRARFHGPGLASGVALGPEAQAEAVDLPIEAAGRTMRFTFVDVGNPHCVVMLDSLDPRTVSPGLGDLDLPAIGSALETHRYFPHRANVEFIDPQLDGSVSMRVWERGAGETRACGTGATAVAAACVRLGLCRSPVTVHLLGGDLVVEVLRDGWAFMTGPAEEVFTGSLSGGLMARLGW